MNSAAARAEVADLSRITRTTPCVGCGEAALAFTSLCRRCYRVQRPLGKPRCPACGGPLRFYGGQSCGTCYHRVWRARQKGA